MEEYVWGARIRTDDDRAHIEHRSAYDNYVTAVIPFSLRMGRSEEKSISHIRLPKEYFEQDAKRGYNLESNLKIVLGIITRAPQLLLRNRRPELQSA